MVFATRLTPRLRRSLRRLDDGSRPIAELNRLLGAQAERASGVRPSYEQVRRAVHVSRLERRREHPHIVVEVRVLPPEHRVARLLRRLGLRRRPPAVFVTACYVQLSGG
jgi:hypothetical protein